MLSISMAAIAHQTGEERRRRRFSIIPDKLSCDGKGSSAIGASALRSRSR